MGQGFEGFAIDVGLALVAAPFRHRENKFDPGIVGDAGHGGDVVPVGFPPFGCEAHGQPAVAIGAENPQLEPVHPEQWIICSGFVHSCTVHGIFPRSQLVLFDEVPEPPFTTMVLPQMSNIRLMR